uniref:Uncharacterized protein n=1 Tax=Rhizophora mucronata TaxID=61149 RepID=A0A2P2L385_RHIMU
MESNKRSIYKQKPLPSPLLREKTNKKYRNRQYINHQKWSIKKKKNLSD